MALQFTQVRAKTDNLSVKVAKVTVHIQRTTNSKASKHQVCYFLLINWVENIVQSL